MAWIDESKHGSRELATAVSRIVAGELTVREACRAYGVTPAEIREWAQREGESTLAVIERQLAVSLTAPSMPEPPSVAVFRSSQGDIPVADLVSTVVRGGKHGVISIESRGLSGRLWCGAGEVVDAQWMHLSGVLAAYRILALSEAELVVRFTPLQRPRQIREPLTGLLLESLRRRDRLEELLEALDGRGITRPLARPGAAKEAEEAEERTLLQLLDGRRPLPRLLDHSPFGDVETLQLIAALERRDLVIQAPESLAETPEEQDIPPISTRKTASRPPAAQRSVSGFRGVPPRSALPPLPPPAGKSSFPPRTRAAGRDSRVPRRTDGHSASENPALPAGVAGLSGPPTARPPAPSLERQTSAPAPLSDTGGLVVPKPADRPSERPGSAFPGLEAETNPLISAAMLPQEPAPADVQTTPPASADAVVSGEAAEPTQAPQAAHSGRRIVALTAVLVACALLALLWWRTSPGTEPQATEPSSSESTPATVTAEPTTTPTPAMPAVTTETPAPEVSAGAPEGADDPSPPTVQEPPEQSETVKSASPASPPRVVRSPQKRRPRAAAPEPAAEAADTAPPPAPAPKPAAPKLQIIEMESAKPNIQILE